MLAQDILMREKNQATMMKTKSQPQRDLVTKKKYLRNKSPKRLDSQNKALKINHQNRPFLLKCLIIIGNTSSLVCYLSVAIAFILYGMTVYAPKLWTQKYQELQNLQKQERQFSFTDEIMKNQLAESANQSGSGFVNPDATQPPIFLPDSNPKPIELKRSNSPIPKHIDKISPIAY
ncbi:hypothetical protein [Geminocystis sp. GBBB08]|uniref:hypothetical protein n=1 Tax=Geminocystis sp. GBBB08 TaxID=2604140 RepID=UPI0027E38B80|nr:hypothetical protein [Geminocystis sp. GBBB08]MBL1210296.1 hypothetical protein [Geminocystis sp. GBBB08]